MSTMYNPILVTIVIAGTILMMLVTLWAMLLNISGKRKIQKLNRELDRERSTSDMVLAQSENYFVNDVQELKNILKNVIPEHANIRKRIFSHFTEQGNHNHVEELCIVDPETREPKWWEVRYIVMHNEGHTEVNSIFISINARKKYENNMIRLEKKVNQRETSNELFCTFAENYCNIHANLVALCNKYVNIDAASDDSDIKDIADSIRQYMSIMDRLTADYKDFLAVEQHTMKLNIETISVNDFLRELYEKVATDIQQRGFKIFLVEGRSSMIRADKAALFNIYNRIIENALHFTKDGLIVIGWKSDLNNRKIEVFVEDSGIGIDEDDIEHVFEPGWVADRNNPNTGMGLGLGICKTYAEAMGGCLKCTSEKGIGTRVHIEFKLA